MATSLSRGCSAHGEAKPRLSRGAKPLSKATRPLTKEGTKAGSRLGFEYHTNYVRVRSGHFVIGETRMREGFMRERARVLLGRDAS